jgi:hypothetical protein
MRTEEFINSVLVDCQVDLHQVEITENGLRFKIVDSDCEFAFDVYEIVQEGEYNYIAFPEGLE